MAPKRALSIIISGDASDLSRAFHRANRDTEKEMRGISGTVRKHGVGIRRALVGAAAGAVTLGEGIHVLKQSVSTLEVLAKGTLMISRSTGLDNKEASEWVTLAKIRGVEAKQLNMGFVALARNIRGAQEGTKASVAAFKELGISQAEIKRGDSSEIIRSISDAFQKMPDGANKAALAQKLFSRQAATLLPLINRGSGELQKQLNVVDEYGAALDKHGVKKAMQAVEAQHHLEIAWQGVEITLGEAVIPLFTKGAKALGEFIKQFREGRGQGGRFRDQLIDIGHKVSSVYDTLKKHAGIIKIAAAAWVAYRVAASGATRAAAITNLIGAVRGPRGVAGGAAVAGRGAIGLGVGLNVAALAAAIALAMGQVNKGHRAQDVATRTAQFNVAITGDDAKRVGIISHAMDVLTGKVKVSRAEWDKFRKANATTLKRAGIDAGLTQQGVDSLAKSYRKLGSPISAVNARVQDAARVFADYRRTGSNNMSGLQSAVGTNMSRIVKRLGADSAEGKDALAKNFHLAAGAVRQAMQDGMISTRDGLAYIKRLFHAEMRQYGFSAKQADNIKRGLRPDGGPEEGSAAVGDGIGKTRVQYTGDGFGSSSPFRVKTIPPLRDTRGDGALGNIVYRAADNVRRAANDRIRNAALSSGSTATGKGLKGARASLGPVAAIGQRFGLGVSSGRQGREHSITSSGNISYHSSGEAVDMADGRGPDSNKLRFFRYMKRNFGPRLAELIYTPGGKGIKDGRAFQYTGAVAAQHFDHVHVAIDTGKPGVGDGHGKTRRPGRFTGDGVGVAGKTTGSLGGTNRRTEAHVGRELMHAIWKNAKGFIPGAGGMPPTTFTTGSDALFIGADETGHVYWPDWFNKDFVGKDGPRRWSTLETLIHEWAHTRQKKSLSMWEGEGGAVAFARRVSPLVYGRMGINYQNPPTAGEGPYAPYLSRVKKERGEKWIMGGQFTGPSRGRKGHASMGSFSATSYGPPWGGIQGGGTTATGVNLHSSPHKYGVAVDPSVIPLGTKLKIHPNPFGYGGAFEAFDTGGAIKGKRIDFYDWRGRAAQNGWGRRNVTVSEASSGAAGGKHGRGGAKGRFQASQRAGGRSEQRAVAHAGGPSPGTSLGGGGGYDQVSATIEGEKATAQTTGNVKAMIRALYEEAFAKRTRLRKINRALKRRLKKDTRLRLTEERTQLIQDLKSIGDLVKEYSAYGMGPDGSPNAAPDASQTEAPTATDYLDAASVAASFTPGTADDIVAAKNTVKYWQGQYDAALKTADPRDDVTAGNALHSAIDALNNLTGATEEASRLQQQRDDINLEIAENQRKILALANQGPAVIAAVIAAVNGGIGGQIGLGTQSPGYAGRLARY